MELLLPFHLKRSLPIDRDVEYQISGDLLAETLNGDQDYQTYLILDSNTESDRLLKLPDTDVNMSSSLPTSIANYGLFVNDAGTAFEYRVADATGGALKAWESEANSLTSASYATQVEDTFVDEYASNGDGTFTTTPTTEYSALHWAIKAADSAASVDYASGKYVAGDSDNVNLTATVSESRYMKIGNVVHVSGSAIVTLSSIGAGTFSVNLPIASALISTSELSGVISTNIPDVAGLIKADTGNDKAEFTLTNNVSTTVGNIRFEFSYYIY